LYRCWSAASTKAASISSNIVGTILADAHEKTSVRNIKVQRKRFQTCVLPPTGVVPGEDKWISSMMEVICLCLEASLHHHPPGDKKDRAVFYERHRKVFSKEISDAGSLITNHLMAVFIIFGLVPLWFAEEHTVKTSSKLIACLISEKGLVKGKRVTQHFLDSLSSALECQHGIAVTHKSSENVGSKTFPLMCNKGRMSGFLIWSLKWQLEKFTCTVLDIKKLW
jgi:hypothetical protein